MKAIRQILVLAAMLGIAAISLTGCEDNNETIVFIDEEVAPPIPQGVYSVTGDETVFIFWNHVEDIHGDFSNYIVYRSDTPPYTTYWPIGQTTGNEFVDDNLVNGKTYFYAVASIDIDGFESDLSYEDVFDTPRPEGFGQVIYDFNTTPSLAGWDFEGQTLVGYTSSACDFYVERFDGIWYINAGRYDLVNPNLTDIQDMGFTVDFDEISYSPPADSGWSVNQWAEAIVGHTYVFWTEFDHFAKVRVTHIAGDSLIFDWGYQVDPSNRELKPRVPNEGP